ncbi:aldo/keto reductase [Helicobacter muridarum]|uniref:Oxidoreductase, aldo/keto reductase family n=2 Tax=Helicobacter muridarum TaxID=216 RepID=A0A377PW45_9HELI|nr:aldo/keto reductase [Helicobacter muridarum]STQ86865.1 oxidoreductase, aldo/keto reductase family [Helicobacter muridarum]
MQKKQKSTESLARREFLKTSVKFGTMASVASLSSFALSACDSKTDSKDSTNGAQNQGAKNVESQTQISQNKGDTMEFITLNNGVKMPILGYGVYQIEAKETQRCVEDAISVGYRSIDTAQAYFNEEGVGAAIKTALQGGLKREELFITTKLWINNYPEDKALKACEESLRKLGLDYVDLMLLHQPYNDTYGAWRALSRFYKEGRFKAIGVSNFYPDRIVDFCLNNEIKPTLNQIECNPLHAQFEAQKVLQEYNVAMESWAPFGEGRNNMFSNPTLGEIGKKYNKSVAQVILRWQIQRGIICIPKTTRKERMIENINVFDFALSEDDMQTIASLDSKTSLFFNHQDPERVKFLVEIHKDKF